MRDQLKVVAVGDLQLGDSPICVGFGFASKHGSPDEFKRVFDGVRPLLQEADLVVGNLETVLMANSGSLSLRSSQLRGHLFYAQALKELGFTVLHVANNHAVQHGLDAFHESVAALRAVGIECCGLRGSDHWTALPVRINAQNGARVGVLGYSRRPQQYGTVAPPYAEGADQAVLADVSRLRPEVDHLIVSLHWGEEFVTLPSEEERSFAIALVGAGVDVIVGHHPHVSRPVEIYNGSVIAYSLGNFVADMVWQPVLRRGLLLRCHLAQRGAEIVSLSETQIDDSFRVSVARTLVPDPQTTSPTTLDDRSYREAVARTLHSQQLAGYRFALQHVFHYPPLVLWQLLTATLWNKLSTLFT